MDYAAPIIDGYNAVVGTIVAVLSYIMGDHWVLFLAFLLLNVGDWLTGWVKSRLAGKENSVAESKILKACTDRRKIVLTTVCDGRTVFCAGRIR